jgi:outer membrane protein OmpA-like peptidoglycan-associated protein
VTPILELRSADGALTIDGIVSSDSLRASLLKAGLTAYGMRNLNNRLAVNAAVAPFEWSGDAADLILLVGGPESETTLRIDGNTVTLAGEVPELQDKQARALAAQQFFGTRARVDNRLRVVAVDETDAQKQASTEKLDVDSLGKKEPSASESGDTRREQPLAAVVPANGDSKTPAAADLAEGGPGQVDSVTLLPSGLPKRIARGDCPKVATSVLIPFGSATVDLTEAARAALDQLAPCLSRRNYLVGGHTDNRGSPANNRALSKERAQAVVDYLIEAGVPARRLTAVGYGEARPIISNRSERGRARNRRVDFRFKR